MQPKDTGARPKEFVTSTPLLRQRPSDSGVGTTVASRYQGEEPRQPSLWSIPPQGSTYSPRITRAESKRRELNDTREKLRLQREDARQQRIRIRRDVPDAPIILEATGYDVDATIYHGEPTAAEGFHISVEDVEPHENTVSTDEQFFDSVSDQPVVTMSTPPPPNPGQQPSVQTTPVLLNPLPIPMPNPFPPPPTPIQPPTPVIPPTTATSADDLLRVMQGMMATQNQQFTQMLAFMQHVTQTTVPPQPTLAPVVATTPAATNKKIRPTLPKYDGRTDADDHMDQFVAIANAEHWTNDDRKQNFYKTLVKTASTWYVRNAEVIEAGTWEQEQAMFLDYFRSPTFKADQHVQAMTRLHQEGETVREYANEKARLWKRVDSRITDFTLLNHIQLGLSQDMKARLGGTRVATLHELLESCKAIEKVKKHEATTAAESSKKETGKAKETSKPAKPSSTTPKPEAKATGTKAKTKSSPDVSEGPKCYNCGRTGHIARECKRPLTERTKQHREKEKALQRKQATKVREHNDSNEEDEDPITGFLWNYPEEDESSDEMVALTGANETKNPLAKLNLAEKKTGQGRCVQRTTKISGGLPTVRIRLNRQSMLALVDSGASVSLLPESLVQTLQATVDTTERPRIMAADGKNISMKGTVNLKVQLRNRTFKHVFYVMKEPEQGKHIPILGNDFGMKAQLIINQKGPTVYFWDELKESLSQNDNENDSKTTNASVAVEEHFALPFLIEDSDSNEDVNLIAKVYEDVVIPPMTQMGIKLQYPVFTKNRSDRLLEGLPTLATEKGVKLANGIVTPNATGEFQAILANLGNDQVCLKRGMTVGHLTAMDNATVTSLKPSPKAGRPEPFLQDLDWNIGPNLTEDERRAMLTLLRKYRHVFATSAAELGNSSIATHRIDTQGLPPVHVPPRRTSPGVRDIINKELDEMLRHGIVRPSVSEYSSPVVIVSKKDGGMRFCVDYRKLNEQTRIDQYPLPRIDDALDSLTGAQYFTTLDLASGYWQLRVKEEDIAKTAFACHRGLFEFVRMPFGLCNAPATMQRALDVLLAKIKWETCLIYLDDIITHGPTFPLMLRNLEEIFQLLESADLKLKPSKCFFGFDHVNYLGHVVSGKGISPDPAKIAAVENFPRPTTRTELRSFLGLASYYRRFVKHFARIASPLHAITSDKATFEWTPECEEAFTRLKTLLISAPILTTFDPNLTTSVHTDSSIKGLGAVLYQGDKPDKRVLAYASRTLLQNEKNYGTPELEMLAIIWAVKKFRSYFFGRPFNIVTDHHSLCTLKRVAEPKGRLARWILELAEHQYTIVHRSGIRHGDADALSRCPLACTEADSLEEEQLFATTDQPPPDLDEINRERFATEQRLDQNIVRLIDEVQTQPDTPLHKNFCVIEGLLYRRQEDKFVCRLLIVVPAKMTNEIMFTAHDSDVNCHLGYNKTVARILRTFWWENLRTEVAEYVRTCDSCQRHKKLQTKPAGLLHPIPPPEKPAQHWGIDFIGPFPSAVRGMKYVLIAVDYCSKYLKTQAVRSATAKSFIGFLKKAVIDCFGIPLEVTTDQGTQITSNLAQDFFAEHGIRHTTSSAYHQQGDGLAERGNKTIFGMVRQVINPLRKQKDWADRLPACTIAYNSSRHASVKYTPFYLHHGYEYRTKLEQLAPVTPEIPKTTKDRQQIVDAHRADATRNLLAAQQKQKIEYDKKHRDVSYPVDSLVFFENLAPTPGLIRKLVVPFLGPARVIQISSDGLNYTLQYTNPKGKTREIVRHVSQLKACTPRKPDKATTTTTITSRVHQVANDAKPSTPRKCDPVLQEVLPKLTPRMQTIFTNGKYVRSDPRKATETRNNLRNITCVSPDPSADLLNPQRRSPTTGRSCGQPTADPKPATAASQTTKSVVAEPRATKSVAAPLD